MKNIELLSVEVKSQKLKVKSEGERLAVGRREDECEEVRYLALLKCIKRKEGLPQT
jgi:hypothetical protein